MNIYSLYNEYIHFITLLHTHDNTVCIDIELNHLQEISRVTSYESKYKDNPNCQPFGIIAKEPFERKKRKYLETVETRLVAAFT